MHQLLLYPVNNICLCRRRIWPGVLYVLRIFAGCMDSHTLSTDCGNAFSNGGTQAASTDCNMACTGNAQEICGAGGQQILFMQQYHAYRYLRSPKCLLEWRSATIATYHGTQRRALEFPWLLQARVMTR